VQISGHLDISKSQYGIPIPIEISQLPILEQFYAVDAGMSLNKNIAFYVSQVTDTCILFLPIAGEMWVDLNPNIGGEIPDIIGDKATLGKSDG
jgi:hypothetical protein